MATTTFSPTTLTPATQPTTLLASTLVVAKRALKKFMRTPQLVVLGTIQGVMFLLIFRYVFGGAIGLPGGLDYVNFLVPGFITTGVLFGGMSASIAMAEDMEQGFVDRLRSLPMPRSSVLTGRSVADTVIQTWSTTLMVIVGFVVGFRIHGTIGAAILAYLLLIVFGFAFEWLFLFLGMAAGNAQAAQGMALLVFPFTFISSAFVPVDSLPGVLKVIATHQPITFMVNAVRTLTQGKAAEVLLGHPASYWVSRSLLWCVVLVAVFAPLAIGRYRRG
ncbi:MAG TPA: ABC transporter permease [Actinomycetota bacterium]|nr:ABC transporter permease [Actinomycetota bacterium]